MTRLKLAFLWLATLGVGVSVALWQWRAAGARETFGNPAMARGIIEQTAFSLLLSAIPAVAAAIVVYLGLMWLLFRKGELEAYEDGRRVKATKRTLDKAAASYATITRAPDASAMPHGAAKPASEREAQEAARGERGKGGVHDQRFPD